MNNFEPCNSSKSFYSGYGKEIFNNNFVERSIIGTKPPTPVFLLTSQMGEEKALCLAELYLKVTCQVLIFLFYFLEERVPLWPDIDWLCMHSRKNVVS